MSAYLLILFAMLSRVTVASHHSWLNFTAIGGSLLFSARDARCARPFCPSLLSPALDYYMTVYVYSYPFAVQDYLITWAWYAAVIVLGHLLLRERRSSTRVAAAVVLSSTSFFLASNFAAWTVLRAIYPHTFSGLMTAYAAGLPFYRNDLLSTTLVAGLVFGLPALVEHYRPHEISAHKAA